MMKCYDGTEKRGDVQKDWVWRAQSGEKDAMEKLLAAYQPLMLSMAAKYNPGNSQDREDALQDSAVALMEAILNYDLGSEMYLALYLRNQLFYAMMARSRRAKEPPLSLDAPMVDSENANGTLGDTLADDTPPAVDSLIRTEEVQAVAALVEDCRNVSARSSACAITRA